MSTNDEAIKILTKKENLERYVENANFERNGKNLDWYGILIDLTEFANVMSENNIPLMGTREKEDGTNEIIDNVEMLSFEVDKLYSKGEIDFKKKYRIIIEGEDVSEDFIISESTLSKVTLTIEKEINKNKEFKNTANKKKRPNLKLNKEYSSTITSGVATEIMKENKPNEIDRAKKEITSKHETDIGIIQISKYIPDMDKYSFDTDEEMLKQYNLIKLGYTREEFQIFQALFDVFLTEGKKKNYNQPIEISIKDLHYNILGHNKNTKFRSKDIEYYRNKASSLSRQRIHYTTTNAKHSYLLKGKYKNLHIDGNIMNVEFIEGENSEFKEQILRVIPTSYMQHEAIVSKQISNCLPREFLNLKEHDNFVYFGFYINKMHKLNSKQKEVEEKIIKGKIIKNTVNSNVVSHGWEVNLKKLILEAIPNGKELILEFEKTERKKQFLERNIIPYLVKVLDVYKSKGYILKYNKKDLTNKNIKTKNIFDEETGLKVKLIFNYQKEKFKSQKP